MNPASLLPVITFLLVADSIASRILASATALARDCMPSGPPEFQRGLDRIFWGLTVVYFVVIAFFGLGHNWARWVVMVASLVPLTNVFLISKVKRPSLKLYMAADVVFCVCLIYWLLRPDVARLFTG